MNATCIQKHAADDCCFSDPDYGSLQKGAYPRVALVMPVGRDSLPITRASITTLYDVTAYANWTLVTINDAAGEETDAFLRSIPESVKLGNATRRGFSENTNAGIRAVDADYYVLFSNDVLVFDPYWLHKMVALAESDARIAVVGAGFNSCGSFWHLNSRGAVESFHYYHVKFLGRKPFECQSVSGFNMMVKAAVMKKIGSLDEGYYPAYGEETDFCFRVVASGYRVMDCLLPVYHVVRGGWRGKIGLQGRDRVRYPNSALAGSVRRLALRWGSLLPTAPAPTYREAVLELRRIAEIAPRLFALQPDLPPTCNLEGVVNLVFELPFPMSAQGAFTLRGWWTRRLIQVGRVCKLVVLLLRGRYDPKAWTSPSEKS